MQQTRALLTTQRLRISVLGCGWSGMPLTTHLVEQGFQVAGSTTTTEKAEDIRSLGAKPLVWSVTDQWGMTPERKSFLAVDVLVVTLPPPKKAGCEHYARDVHRSVASAAREVGTRHVIVFSSTSVYPDEPAEYTEEDAQRITSRHTGIAMKDLEDVYREAGLKQLTILRFGGLFGPGRQPGRFVLRSGEVKNPGQVVNMTHLEDVIGAVCFVIGRTAGDEVYNIVSPKHPFRGDFYREALRNLGVSDRVRIPRFDAEKENLRKVLSDHICRHGYVFKEPDPIEALKKVK